MRRLFYISKGLIKTTGGAESAASHILNGILNANKYEKVVILTNKPPKVSDNIIKCNLIAVYQRLPT